MRNGLYILVLLAFITGCFGYIYFGSEIQTVKVMDKYTGTGQTRRGFSTETYIIETDRGRMQFLSFPVIGYTTGAEQAFNSLHVGATVKLRVGMWPPSWFGQQPKPRIMNIYR